MDRFFFHMSTQVKAEASFFFCMSTQVKAKVRSTKAVT
jgi:hypothetical protein